MRRFLVWSLGLLAALVAAVLLLLIFPPTGWIAGKIEEIVAARTGYALDIGDLDLDLLSFTPSATVSAVSVDGAELPGLLDLGRAEVAVDLRAALGGEIVIDRVVAEGPKVSLLRTADGRTSWTPGPFEPPEQDPDEADTELALPTIRELRIEDLRVVVNDELTGNEAEVTVQASGSTSEGEPPLNVAVDGTANGAPVQARLDLESPLDDALSGGPVRVALDASTDGAKVALSGSIAEPATLGGLDLVLDADVESLDGLETALNRELPALAPATLDATLKSEGDDVVLAANGTAAGEPLQASLALDLQGPILEAVKGDEPVGIDLAASVGGAKLGVTGSVGDPASLGDVDLALDADVRSLDAVETLLGRDLPPLDTATLSATVKSGADGKGYAVRADGAVDGEPVKASLDVDASVEELLAGEPVNLDLDAAVGGAKVKASGGVEDIRTLEAADLDIDVDIDSLAALEKLSGTELPDIEPASLSTTLRTTKDGNAVLEADGTVGGEPARARVALGTSIEKALAGGPLDLDVDAAVGGAQVALSGRVGNPRTLGDIDLKLDADIDSLAALEKLAGAELPDLEPASLSATLKSEGERTVLEAEGTVDGAPVSATATLESSVEGLLAGGPVTLDASASVGGAKLAVKGDIEDPKALKGVDLALDADVESLAAVETLLGTRLPDVEPASLTGRVLTDGDEYVLRGLDLAAAGSTLAGDVRVNPVTGPPTVYANLVSKRLDVDALLEALGIESAEDVVEDEAEPKDGDIEGPVLSSDPLPIDALFGAAQGRAELRVDELVYAAVPLESFSATAELAPALATIELDEVALAGGDAGATLRLEPTDGQGSLDAKLDMRLSRVQVGRFVPDDIELLDDFGGPLGGQVELWASGDSVAALAGSLDGGVSLLMGKGRLDSLFVEIAGLDLFQSIGEVIDPGEQQFQLRCAYASLLADGGIVSLDNFVIDSSDTVFLARGTVDLGKEALDLALEPHPKDASLLAAATGVKIGGTFAEPAIEVGSSLPGRAALAAALAVVATPAAALLPFIGIGGADDSGFCDLEGALDGDAG